MKTGGPRGRLAADWLEAATVRSQRSRHPEAATRLKRATARFAAFMAALLALVLSGAPAAAAAAVGPSASTSSVVDEHLEEREATADARRAVRARLERPNGAVRVASRPVVDRGARPAAPLAATRFIPPQRKTLLRLLH